MLDWVWSLVLTFLAAGAGAGQAAGAGGEGELVDVRLVSRVGDGAGAADESAKHARQGEQVTLFVAVAVRRDGKTVWYSDAGSLRLRGGKQAVTARPLAEAGTLAIAWYKLQPEVATMSNEASGRFRFEPIPYQAVEQRGWRGRGAVAADVRPDLIADHGGGLGTMRFQVAVGRAGAVRASPGVEARRGKGSGGLGDEVHRVSIRRDDSYLGWLTEMYGQPYIWASAGASAATHQSERLEGSDCADFVTYGWRRLGHDVPYTWTGGLPELTRGLAKGTPRAADGVYVDAKGREIPFPRAGDLVIFPRHVGALVRDEGVAGVLDEEDVIVHTLFDTPREQAIRDTAYAGKPVDVRRWE